MLGHRYLALVSHCTCEPVIYLFDILRCPTGSKAETKLPVNLCSGSQIFGSFAHDD